MFDIELGLGSVCCGGSRAKGLDTGHDVGENGVVSWIGIHGGVGEWNRTKSIMGEKASDGAKIYVVVNGYGSFGVDLRFRITVDWLVIIQLVC